MELGQGEICPSTFECEGETPIIYRQFARDPDAVRRSPRHIKQPLTTYKQIPSDLSRVTPWNSHISVVR
jgi:hypothetical protein